MSILSNTRGAPASKEIRSTNSLPLAGSDQLEDLQSIFNKIDVAISDSLTRPTIIFHSDAACQYTGLQVDNFDSSIEIRIVQTDTGAVHLYQIPAGHGLVTAGDGDICYAILSRDGAGTGTVPSTDLTAANGNLVFGTQNLPALERDNIYFIPILMRIDGEFGKRYIHWFFGHGVWAEGSQAQVGLAGTADDPVNTASLLSMRAENRWMESKYEFFTDNIIARYTDTRIDSDNFPFTAALDDAQENVEFAVPGLSFTSTNLADPYFLKNGSDIYDCELILFYDKEFLDPNPVVEISRDGGINFSPMDMNFLEGTDTFHGNIYFPEEAPSTVEEYIVNDSLFALTDTARFFSQKILNSQVGFYADSVYMNLAKQTSGALEGALRVAIYKDDGLGFPSTELWTTSQWVDITDIAVGASSHPFKMRSIVPYGEFHIVLEASQAYQNSYNSGTDYIGVAADAASVEEHGYISFDMTSWVALNATVNYSFEGRLLDLRVRVTSSQGDTTCQGYAVMYGSRKTIESGFINLNKFTFSASQNEFILDFIPDHRSLTCFVRGTGQVYREGDFEIEGKKVIFPVGFFDDAGTSNTIEFVQQFGYSIDSSDTNRALLRENRLGSTDADLDLSEAGRGIRLRASNGQLVEFYIDHDGANYNLGLIILP
jgi:hypothetical protein